MPKIVITEKDETGSISLPSTDHAVYIPGLMKDGSAVPPRIFSTTDSLDDARTKEGINYDDSKLSYKLANYLLNTLGMTVVFEGLPSDKTSVPKESWTYLENNRDRIPVRFLTTGEFKGLDQNAVNCAKHRGDCTALLCIDETKIEDGTTTSDTPYAYIPLTTEPADWDTNYTDYFEKTYINIPEGSGTAPEFVAHTYWVKVDDIYYCLGEKPSDWDNNYTSYYYKNYINISEGTGAPTFIINTYYKGLYYSSYDAASVRAAFDVIQEGQYAAGFTPSFYTEVSDLIVDKESKIQEIPAPFGYLFAYARMIQTYPEWIATAGAVNGVIPELKEPLYYYSDADAQILQGHESGASDSPDDLDDLIEQGVAVNPILDEYPFGVVIWGARTLKLNKKAEGLKATSFLNIRNLVSTLKKVLRKAARRFTFSQNSDVLWYNFKSMIEPTLEEAKNGNGIEGYLIEQLSTPAKARLKAKITIVPIEPVEDFDLEIVLTDSITVNE